MSAVPVLEPPPFPGRYRASRYMSAVPVLETPAPRTSTISWALPRFALHERGSGSPSSCSSTSSRDRDFGSARLCLEIGINIAYPRAMSFPFDIPCGSPLVAIEAWTPDDLVQFAHRAAAGLDSSMLAQVSAVEEQVVEALLAEPVIAALVEEYGRMLEMSDEEFRARLRPFVRMVIEHEVRKPKPKGPFLFYLFFCLEIAGDDPVQKVIKSLLSSLRRKRRKPGFGRSRRGALCDPQGERKPGFGRSRRRDAPCDPHEPAKFTPVFADAAPRPRLESELSSGARESRKVAGHVEPTEKELLAESMVRFANRGRRILALKIAEELASRNLAFGRSHRRDARCDPHEPEKFTPVLADAAPRPRRECEVSKGVEVAAGANEDAVQRPPTQHQSIEKSDVTAPEKVIEGCGDRVDPHFYISSPSTSPNSDTSPYPDRHPQAP